MPMQVADLINQIKLVYAQQALWSTLPQLYFRQFVQFKEELGRQPGETIRFLKIGALPKGGKLTEGIPIPKNKYTDSTVDITVNEYGNSTGFSRAAMEASFRSVMDDASKNLGRDYGLVQDEECRDAYLSTANTQWANGQSADADVTSADTLDTTEIKEAIETLSTSNVPKVVRGGDQHYVGIFHPHQMRGIMDDPDFQSAVKYGRPSDLYNGEVGRYMGVVFLSTTQMPILTGVGSGGIDLYRGTIFGADAVGFAETVPFQLRTNGIEDYERQVSIAWYSIFGVGILDDNIVEVRTA